MIVQLIDGTYELFRQHFGRPLPGPYGAAAGVVASTITLLEQGATHIGVASDHTIESFRNDLWAGYKTSEGMLPELLIQIPVMEEALAALGVTVWPMVEFEADDALAAAAAVANADDTVTQVQILTSDKDLGQCVGGKVVQVDRRNSITLDAAAVREKFGVGPASIPDYLGLVGDTADGFPGLAGWGAKSASAVLAVYEHLENIPAAAGQWDVPGLRGAQKLAATLSENRELAMLFRKIATVRTDVSVGEVGEWGWAGPTPTFAATCDQLGASSLMKRVDRLCVQRGLA